MLELAKDGSPQMTLEERISRERADSEAANRERNAPQRSLEERITAERTASETANRARNAPKLSLEERILRERRASEGANRARKAPRETPEERVARERRASEAANRARNAGQPQAQVSCSDAFVCPVPIGNGSCRVIALARQWRHGLVHTKATHTSGLPDVTPTPFALA